jgi:hypothetical protein
MCVCVCVCVCARARARVCVVVQNEGVGRRANCLAPEVCSRCQTADSVTESC